MLQSAASYAGDAPNTDDDHMWDVTCVSRSLDAREIPMACIRTDQGCSEVSRQMPQVIHPCLQEKMITIVLALTFQHPFT